MNITEMMEKYGWEDNEYNRKLIAEFNARESEREIRMDKLISEIKADIDKQINADRINKIKKEFKL